ncbi:MAG: hypothetical protein Ct9H90mP6_00940 [Gammaproteobacteria bacterium]|nr:MAG: hypothetical protein Ct9H90mP6_00940 [Gammaproteobacteria bacterium]
MNLIILEPRHVKHLKKEGYRVILVNLNPATIMTDPLLADATYIEPIHLGVSCQDNRKGKTRCTSPQTLGGQTGLNTALSLAKGKGKLKKI